MKKRLFYTLCLGAMVSASSLSSASAQQTQDAAFSAPDAAWRDVNPENSVYIQTVHGTMVVELFPEIAPNHVQRIKTLTRSQFYDGITFHRVIKDFMNQTGDPLGNGTGGSELPDMPPEFTFKRTANMRVTGLAPNYIDPSRQYRVGFYNGLPVTSQPIAQAMWTKDGTVKANGLHCKGVASMARSSAENSGNSQFFLLRDTAKQLDEKYSIWGNTVWGREVLKRIKVGTVSDTPNFVPDRMDTVRMGADLPPSERLNIQVLDTNSQAFKNYLKTYQKTNGTYPDICDIDVPMRLKP